MPRSPASVVLRSQNGSNLSRWASTASRSCLNKCRFDATVAVLDCTALAAPLVMPNSKPARHTPNQKSNVVMALPKPAASEPASTFPAASLLISSRASAMALQFSSSALRAGSQQVHRVGHRGWRDELAPVPLMDVPIAIRRKSARMSGFIAFLLSGLIRRGDGYGCMPYGGKESLMALHGYAQHILCLVSLVFLVRLRLGIEAGYK